VDRLHGPGVIPSFTVLDSPTLTELEHNLRPLRRVEDLPVEEPRPAGER